MASHNAFVAQAVKAMKRVDRDAVIRAFVGSLSTRNLPARSAFGSYIVLQNLQAHAFQKSKEFDEDVCACCGLTQKIESLDADECEERIGGYPFQVQHTDLEYAASDIASFASREVDAPTAADTECLGKLLDAIRALPAGAQLGELEKSISKSIKSSKHERQILLETFGYAGILCPKSKHNYCQKFVTYDDAESDQPKEFYKQEWAYPVRFWTGRDGVNEKQVKALFGKYV